MPPVPKANGKGADNPSSESSQSTQTTQEKISSQGSSSEESLDEDLVPRPPPGWIFNKSEVENSPSRIAGVPLSCETYYKERASDLIQMLGCKLRV